MERGRRYNDIYNPECTVLLNNERNHRLGHGTNFFDLGEGWSFEYDIDDTDILTCPLSKLAFFHFFLDFRHVFFRVFRRIRD